MTTSYTLDTVYGLPVVVQVDVQDGNVSTDVWSLGVARAILSDKQHLAAEYERDGDLADRDGRVSDAAIFRASASTLLTQAHDLFVVLGGAENLSDRRAA
jgi:hypothetical protein